MSKEMLCPYDQNCMLLQVERHSNIACNALVFSCSKCGFRRVVAVTDDSVSWLLRGNALFGVLPDVFSDESGVSSVWPADFVGEFGEKDCGCF